ncbi:hypothetical protein K402DRAFT_103518 [Aulographum hederae CBS 113979]|uniref:Ribosome biogenesis protein SLX9 n=1 Tax=Aulographum hederae CBS 113979 TaxID=1176131 RepID=A0A6G1GXL8_9PEZI|nr:hypothetical protein K402DRAFT_103518 [Aulographum hederae CBS 113979]
MARTMQSPRKSTMSGSTSLRGREMYRPEQDTFSSSKKDKRTMKRSITKSKVEKTYSKPDHKRKKRGKLNANLTANLESLVDALPDVEEGAQQEDITIGQARIRQNTIKSGRGMLKKKEKVIKEERERFKKNMAQMVPATAPSEKAPSTAGNATSDRWAALRSLIGSNIEKKEEFVGT